MGSRPKMPKPPPPPPPAPDLADQALRNAQLTERRRQMGGSRQSSFLTGVLGASAPVSTNVRKLMGG